MKTFQIGDKVRYKLQLQGSLTDRVIAQKYLTFRKVYRVKSIVGDGDHQMIQLRGFGRVWFRSALFKLNRHGTSEEIKNIIDKQKNPITVSHYSPFIRQWMRDNRIAHIV